MSILSMLIIAAIAILHLYILWFEMFAWTKKGPKIFSSLPADLFEPTKSMAANQGLYNGFLAAGLIWSLIIRDLAWAQNVATFFLLCVFVAGIYGAMTVSKKIFFVQVVPATLGLLSLSLL